MSIVSSVTIAGNAYDVYGTETEVKQYIAGRLGTSAYDDASSGDRKKAHVQATRWMDTLTFQGSPTDLVTPQPLAWPRTGMVDCNGEVVVDTVVPDELCEAIGEMVLIVLGDNAASDAAGTGKNIKKVGAGSAQVEFFRTGDAQGNKGTPLPEQAWRLIKCFTGAGDQANSGAIASGTCDESQFDDCDRYELRSGEGFP